MRISCQRFQERLTKLFMCDFQEHKLLAHPIAAGEVDLSCATETRCEAICWLSNETMAE